MQQRCVAINIKNNTESHLKQQNNNRVAWYVLLDITCRPLVRRSCSTYLNVQRESVEMAGKCT